MAPPWLCRRHTWTGWACRKVAKSLPCRSQCHRLRLARSASRYGGPVVVSDGEMVQQLLAVPQEGLPKVKVGANGRDGSQPVVVRTVEDGEPELVEQVLWHGVVVGHGVLLVVLVGCDAVSLSPDPLTAD